MYKVCGTLKITLTKNMLAKAVSIISLLTLLCNAHNTQINNVIDTSSFPVEFSSENDQCRSDIQLFSDSLRNNTLWAYRMWDSSAKLPLGLTEGSQYQLGNFDECLSITEPFASQYCLATIHIKMKVNRTILDQFSVEYKPYINLYEKLDYKNDPVQLPRNKVYWALCLPKSCTVENIQKEFQKYLNAKHSSYIDQFTVEINEEDCQNEQKNNAYKKYTFMDILFCLLIGFFVLTVTVCTMYDFKYIDENNSIKNKKSIKLLLCFSAKQNFHELGKPEGSNKKFRAFYGAKFHLMVAVIIAHGVGNKFMGPVLNYNDIEQINRSFFYMFMARGDVAIDLFFLIGGILNTYSYFSQTEKKNYNALRAIILRYFRSAPVFAITTFFYATLFYKTGTGPLWPKIVGREKQYCDQNWWTNLLLINNYVNTENSCILQGWYLGVDFQLFILSIPLNYLLKKNSKFSWSIFIAVLLASITTPILIIYFGKKEPIFYTFTNYFFTFREIDYFQSVYIPTHTRMSTYIVGMIFGYVYYKFKDSKLKISFVPSFVAFLLVVISGCACVYSGVVFYNPYVQPGVLNGALYSVLHRVAFATAGGLLLFIFSYGSISSHLFTWFPLIPLSKLTFSAYLIHFVFQLVFPASTRNPLHLTLYDLICKGVGELTLSLIAAFMMYIFIESPCIRFMKEIVPSNFCTRNNRVKSREAANP